MAHLRIKWPTTHKLDGEKLLKRHPLHCCDFGFARLGVTLRGFCTAIDRNRCGHGECQRSKQLHGDVMVAISEAIRARSHQATLPGPARGTPVGYILPRIHSRRALTLSLSLPPPLLNTSTMACLLALAVNLIFAGSWSCHACRPVI